VKKALTMAVASFVFALGGDRVEAKVDRRTPIVEAVERSMPAVVNIGTEQMVRTLYSDPLQRFRGDLLDEFFRNFFDTPPTPGYQTTHSLGSGVVVDPDGYILTNYHVIERASRIRVMLEDDELYDAALLAGDPISDLALIKIESGGRLPAVAFAEDDDLMLGETVICLGNPFGLAHTVTVGVLSAKNREARYGGEVLYRDILQTDAAVNPGNSGGPLLNINGELIGINVAIYQQAQNIGFAVPVKRVRALLTQWFSPRLLKKATLGFEPVPSLQGGLVVGTVEPGSAAAKAGLREGAAIRTVNGVPVQDVFGFNKSLLPVEVGSPVAMAIQDGDLQRVVDVTLVALPKPSGEKLARELLGIEFDDPSSSPNLMSYYRTGLPLGEIINGSPASRAGVQPGPLVTRINDIEIRSLDDVGLALENVKAGDTVTLSLATIVQQNVFIIAQTSQVRLVAD
jgi:serine protease Do